MGVDYYIWDGETDLVTGKKAATFIESGSKFIIQGDIKKETGDGYDGTVYIGKGAVLDLENPWILDGKIILEGGEIRGESLRTSPLAQITGWGTVSANVTHFGRIIHDTTKGGIKFTGLFVSLGGRCIPGPCPP